MDWQPGHRIDRLVLEMQAPAPWGRQPGRKSKVFCNEQTKPAASLILMSSLLPPWVLAHVHGDALDTMIAKP